MPLKKISVLCLTIVCLACGYGSRSTTPAQRGTVPVIMQLSPNNAAAGSGAFTLTVNGSSFGGNAVVNWNGAVQPTKFVSANQLTAAIPASAVASSGTANVTVTNPGTMGGPYGGGTMSETSAPMTFTIH